MGGTFDHLVFKVSLGSFGALVLKWSVIRKWLSVELIRLEFGVVVITIWDTFDLLVFKVLFGPFGALVININTAGVGAKLT